MNFDIYDTDEVNEYLFGSLDGATADPLSERFSLTGYSSKSMIFNMGVMLHILMIQMAVCIVYFAVSTLSAVCKTSVVMRLEFYLR